MSDPGKSLKISEEDMNKMLAKAEKEAEKKDHKRQWIERMFKSAKSYYKLCPYYDKKSNQCFLQVGNKCTRDGKYDNCPVFIHFLEEKYNEYISKKKLLPMDFLDLGQPI